MKGYQRKAIRLANECLKEIGVTMPSRRQLKKAPPQCSLYGDDRKASLHTFELSYSGNCYLPHPQPDCKGCQFLKVD